MAEFQIEKFIIGYIETNMYLIHQNRRGVIIDPGFIENEANKIIKKLKKFVDEIPAVLLTHCHFDHISGCPVLKKEFQSEIYCHPMDAKILSDPYKNGAFFFGITQNNITADKLLNEGDIKLIDLHFKIIHTPGHAEGGVSILLENKYLFSGDTIFKDSMGRTDLYGGDYDAEIDSIKNKILKLPEDTIIYPGHGPATAIGKERENFNFLEKQNQDKN